MDWKGSVTVFYTLITVDTLVLYNCTGVDPPALNCDPIMNCVTIEVLPS